MDELRILTRQAPGIATFENFEEIKAYLAARLEGYRNLVYSEDSIKLAKADKATLTKLKKALDERRKEIKAVYMEPYLAVEAQIKELTAMIDEPLAEIDGFVQRAKEAEREAKHAEIKRFYDEISRPLGDLAERVFTSEAFYDKKWENASTKVKVWQDALREKVARAAADLRTIQQTGGSQTPALISRYIETMDMAETAAYQKTLAETAAASQTEVAAVEDEDRVAGYKILKLTGTRQQMAQLMNQIELLGLDWEELEDGMPGELRELTVPDFDSFVAFDIETTGTFGAANGDAEAEITEIGAVKVIGGKIVAREDWLCNPSRPITPMVSRLTHITDEMVADQPPVSEIIRRFADFAEGLPLVGHNIKSSDLHYIIRAANRAGVRLGNSFFDTYRYAKQFQTAQGWPNVRLETLSRLFGIEQNQAHRAWCDAEANVGVYFKLKEMG
jgi:DNA polymerase III epsilon subunit family exonuclease